MAFEPHPWFIGLEGVEHSAEVARTLAWVATSGASGIVKPTDLAVRAQSVPDGSVRIGPGGFVVESKYSGASQQSYVERVPTSTDLEVPATGSSGGATRYVVARITDPDYPGGGTIPPVPNDGVYAAPYLVSSLSSSRTEIPLAKITQPANTAAITNAMITDLREIANPRREEYVFGRPRVTADGGNQQNLAAKTANGGEYFPGGAGSPNIFTLTVPEWATRVMVDASWMSVGYAGNTNPYGHYWIEFGDEYRSHTWPDGKQYEFTTQRFFFNSPGKSNDAMRTNWLLMDALPVAKKLRGKTNVNFAFKAGYSANSGNGVSMDAGGGLGCRITFVEAAETVDLV